MPGGRALLVVVRVGVVVGEVVTAQHLGIGEPSAAERRVVVGDAAVDNTDGDARAGVAVAVGLGDAREVGAGDDLRPDGVSPSAPPADFAPSAARSSAFSSTALGTGVGLSGIAYLTGFDTDATPGNSASRDT